MLVQFTVENFMSFKDEVTLDMRAIKTYKEHEYNLIDIGQKDKYLRVTSVYGANASGKSNLLEALDAFKGIVLKSLDNENPLKKCYIPFHFQEEKENILFEVVQIVDDVEYKYGFEFNEERIVLEWLYSKKLETNRQIVVFERDGDTLNLGASVRKYCENYVKQVPSNSLALSFFNKLKLNTHIFSHIYKESCDFMVLNTEHYDNYSFLQLFLPEEIRNRKDTLVDYFTNIDTGIVDISFEEENERIKFITTHVGANGKHYSLDLINESAGTLKSLVVFIMVQTAIRKNLTILVDELNAKLHPLLMKFIIDLFNQAKDSQAQLIYTTHDTTLLDKKFFRRDQIWFAEKDEYGCSSLTSLAEYKIRSDASFEKDYLSGVYGGIAFMKQRGKKEKNGDG